MELRGRTALVTGGAIRVGRAIALALAGRGANVAVTYRSSEAEASATADEIAARGVRSLALRCDQRDPAQVRDTVSRVEAELGPVDVLVNNAAAFQRTPLETATVEQWDEILETNLRGPWLFAQALGPGMKERGTGAIVNLADIAAERPYPSFLPYCASKAGLVTLTKGLARVLAPEVRVNAVAVGTVLWPDDYPEALAEATVSRTPLRRIGTPEEIAETVLFLMEGPEFVTGVILPVDGGRRLV